MSVLNFYHGWMTILFSGRVPETNTERYRDYGNSNDCSNEKSAHHFESGGEDFGGRWIQLQREDDPALVQEPDITEVKEGWRPVVCGRGGSQGDDWGLARFAYSIAACHACHATSVPHIT